MSEQGNKYIKVEIEGKNVGLWQKHRPTLLKALDQFLHFEIDVENNSTIKQEAQKFTTALLDYGKQKLKKPGLENEKIIAQVELLYSQKQKELAEAKKINAEANAIEFETLIRKLKVYLGMSKVLIMSDGNDEDIIFIKEIESFLTVIDGFETGQRFLR